MERDIFTHMLTYRGKILILSHCKVDNTVDLAVHCFTNNRKSFTKQKEKQLQLNIKGPNLHVISFTCITEHETGIKQPCLLVEKHHSRTKVSLHFLFLVNTSSLVEVASFNLRYSISSLDSRLSDGPSLGWLYKNRVEFLYWNPVSKSLEHSSHVCTNDELCTSSKLLWSGLLNDKLVAMGTVKTERNKTEWLYVDCKSGVMPSDKVVPSVYSPIALCCYVTDVLDINTTSSSHDTMYQVIYIGTTMGQLLEFVHGKLVSHYQLPFNDAWNIFTMEIEDGSTYAIVQSKEKKVCAISCNQRKVVNEWSDKDLVLIDDFLCKGTDQLCLLQGISKDVLTHFVVTNMMDICVTSDQEYQHQNELMAQGDQNLESLHKTIQALRTRLQANTSGLTEKMMECEEKKEMIETTCSTLSRMTGSSGERTTSQKPKIKASNCVCLIEGQKREEKEEYSQPSDVDISVLATWQRVLADKWAVGVELENSGKSIITDISLSLASANGSSIKSKCQKLFHSNNPRLLQLVPSADEETLVSPELNSDEKDCISHLKKRKTDVVDSGTNDKSELKPGENTCVVSVAELPSFHREPKYSCSLVLSWTRYHGDGAPDRKVMSCGQVHLTVDQLDDLNISNTQRTQDKTSRGRDVMAVRAVSMETMLLLTSTVSTLFNAVDLIQHGIQLPEKAVRDVTARDSEECLLHAYDVTGSLHGVAILIRPGYKQAPVQLFTRCSSQIYVIFHKLRHILPDDVTIDVNHTTKEREESQILERVERELNSVMNKLQINIKSQSLNVSEEVKNERAQETSSDCIDVDETRLRKIRADFEKKRKFKNI